MSEMLGRQCKMEFPHRFKNYSNTVISEMIRIVSGQGGEFSFKVTKGVISDICRLKRRRNG